MVLLRIAEQDVEVSTDVATLLAEDFHRIAADQQRLYGHYPALDTEFSLAQKIEDRLVGADDTAIPLDRDELLLLRRGFEILMLGPYHDEAAGLYTLIDNHIEATTKWPRKPR
jgi:hypothetical protein